MAREISWQHENPENIGMLLPKALKMSAIKDTMALVADSIGGTGCASAQVSVKGKGYTYGRTHFKSSFFL